MTYGQPQLVTKVSDPEWDFVIYLVPSRPGKQLAIYESPTRLEVKEMEEHCQFDKVLTIFGHPSHKETR